MVSAVVLDDQALAGEAQDRARKPAAAFVMRGLIGLRLRKPASTSSKRSRVSIGESTRV